MDRENTVKNDANWLYSIFIASIFPLILGGCAAFTELRDLPEGRQVDPETGNYWLAKYSESSGLNYVITFPTERGTASTSRPLIIFLHSMEERGGEINDVIDNPDGEGRGLASYALEDTDFPFATVSPLCPKGRGWPMIVDRLELLVKDILADYPIDPDRIYCTGVSMGGMGVWSWTMEHPERFTAVAPISGGIYSPPMKVDLEAATTVPIWAFHDRFDPSIPLKKEEKPIKELREMGGNVKYTITETGRHYIHSDVFASGVLFNWFLRQYISR